MIGSGASLDPQDRLAVARLQLKDLSQRSAYWLCVLSIACALLLIFGSKLDSYRQLIWVISLLIVTVPYFYLKSNYISEVLISSKRLFLHWQIVWCAWCTIVSLVWISGNWIFVPYSPDYFFNQQSFLYLTILGQVFVIAFLSPSLFVLSGVFILGTLLPLKLIFPDLISHNHRLTSLTSNIFFFGPLIVFTIVGMYVALIQLKSYISQVLLRNQIHRAEAEQSRANNFVMTIGHDLKQPIQAIAFRLRSLKKRVPSELVTTIEEIEGQNRALDEMVHAAFDLSRLDSGNWTTNICGVDLPQLIKQLSDEFLPVARKNNLTLELRPVPSYFVLTDSDALKRILRNLIGNSIKYTPSKRADGPGKIVVECNYDQEKIRISVADNGIGIPDDQLTRIFEPYVQLGNPGRDQTKGFGIGLSIVERLARLLDHDLKVSSSVGRGSRFQIDVPVAAVIPPKAVLAEENPDLRDMFVILIEDLDALREAQAERLIDLGCYVIDGKSGAEAIEKLADTDDLPDGPHLILADYKLEEGTAFGARTGLDAIGELRKACGRLIPAAIWTAESDPKLLQKITAQGVECLIKRAGEKELLALLQKYRPQTAPELSVL